MPIGFPITLAGFAVSLLAGERSLVTPDVVLKGISQRAVRFDPREFHAHVNDASCHVGIDAGKHAFRAQKAN